MWRVSLAMKPSGRPSIRASAVTISGAKRSRRKVTEPSSASVSIDRRRPRRRAAARSGTMSRSARLVGLRARRRSRPGSSRAAAWPPPSPRASSATASVDHAVARLHLQRADLVGVDLAEAAALDHRRAAHAERDVLGGDDQVRAAGEHRVAGEAAAGDDGDPRHQAREPRPEREGARVERRDDRVVGVARPPSAALGEEHGRQPHPLDQLEEAVLLAVAERALGPGEHRVVVGEDRAGGAARRRARR